MAKYQDTNKFMKIQKLLWPLKLWMYLIYDIPKYTGIYSRLYLQSSMKFSYSFSY